MTGGREVGIADSFAQRAGELRRHFVENEDVRRHFADPPTRLGRGVPRQRRRRGASG